PGPTPPLELLVTVPPRTPLAPPAELLVPLVSVPLLLGPTPVSVPPEVWVVGRPVVLAAAVVEPIELPVLLVMPSPELVVEPGPPSDGSSPLQPTVTRSSAAVTHQRCRARPVVCVDSEFRFVCMTQTPLMESSKFVGYHGGAHD